MVFKKTDGMGQKGQKHKKGKQKKISYYTFLTIQIPNLSFRGKKDI